MEEFLEDYHREADNQTTVVVASNGDEGFSVIDNNKEIYLIVIGCLVGLVVLAACGCFLWGWCSYRQDNRDDERLEEEIQATHDAYRKIHGRVPPSVHF